MTKKKKETIPLSEEQEQVIRMFIEDIQGLVKECEVTLKEIQKMTFDFYNDNDQELDKPDPDDNYNFE